MDGARMSECHLGLLFNLYKYSSGFTQLIVGEIDFARCSKGK